MRVRRLFGVYERALKQPGGHCGFALAIEKGERMTRTTVLFTVSAALLLLLATALLLMGLDFGSAEETARSARFRSLPV